MGVHNIYIYIYKPLDRLSNFKTMGYQTKNRTNHKILLYNLSYLKSLELISYNSFDLLQSFFFSNTNGVRNQYFTNLFKLLE